MWIGIKPKIAHVPLTTKLQIKQNLKRQSCNGTLIKNNTLSSNKKNLKTRSESLAYSIIFNDNFFK